MTQPTKLLPLDVIVQQQKKAYDLMAKMGLVGKITWEDHLAFIKAQYHDLKKMDSLKLQQFYDSRGRPKVAVLKLFEQELGKVTEAATTRERLEKAARDAKR